MTSAHPAGERTVSERLKAAAEDGGMQFSGGGHFGAYTTVAAPLNTLLPAIELLEEENRRLKAALERVVSLRADAFDQWDRMDAVERGRLIGWEDGALIARRALSGEGEDGR